MFTRYPHWEWDSGSDLKQVGGGEQIQDAQRELGERFSAKALEFLKKRGRRPPAAPKVAGTKPRAIASPEPPAARLDAGQASSCGAEGAVLPSPTALRDETSCMMTGITPNSGGDLMEVEGTGPLQGHSMPSRTLRASANGSVDAGACLAGHGGSGVHAATAVHAARAGDAASQGQQALRTGDGGGGAVSGRLALRVRFDCEGRPCGWRQEGSELDAWRGSEAVVLRDPLRWNPLASPCLACSDATASLPRPGLLLRLCCIAPNFTAANRRTCAHSDTRTEEDAHIHRHTRTRTHKITWDSISVRRHARASVHARAHVS